MDDSVPKPAPPKDPTAELPAQNWTLDGDLDALLLEPPEPSPSPKPAVPPEPAPSPTSSRAPAAGVASPPPAEKIAEAMLFIGGAPLHPDKFATALRVAASVLHDAVVNLNKKYRAQNRPYTIQTREGGYVLTVKPMYRAMREKLFGGPREARLSQPALDVLSLVAYRQPIDKAEIDSIRGIDSATVLRQLLRLGLITATHRAESEKQDVKYGTTVRFLEVFNLTALEDLPRLGESEQL
jgi:segregation and condensation protein B